jgi:hypothetical protein
MFVVACIYLELIGKVNIILRQALRPKQLLSMRTAGPEYIRESQVSRATNNSDHQLRVVIMDGEEGIQSFFLTLRTPSLCGGA